MSDDTTTTDAKPGDANPGGTEGDAGTATKIALSDAQQDEVNRLLSKERRDAEKRGREAEARVRDEADEQKRKQREADEDKKRGDFEKVEGQLKTDLDAVKADVTRLTGENDRLKAAMTSGVEARWKELPEPVRNVYKGDAEDVLARWEYLHDDAVQALTKELAEKAPAARGNGPDPRGNGAAKPNDEAAKIVNRSRYG